MSGEKENITFDVRRGRYNQIRCQQRKTTSVDRVRDNGDNRKYHGNERNDWSL
jgi:hypothetical protein